MEKTIDIQQIISQLDGVQTSQPLSAGQKKNIDYKPATKAKIVKEPVKKKYFIPKKTAPKKEKTVESSPVAGISDFSLDSEKMAKEWKNIAYLIHEQRKSLGAMLELGTAEKLEKGILTISFIKKYKFQKNIVEKNTEFLQQEISKILNSNIKINLKLSNTVEAAQEEKYSVDAIAKEIAEKFNGEIII